MKSHDVDSTFSSRFYQLDHARSYLTIGLPKAISKSHKQLTDNYIILLFNNLLIKKLLNSDTVLTGH